MRTAIYSKSNRNLLELSYENVNKLFMKKNSPPLLYNKILIILQFISRFKRFMLLKAKILSVVREFTKIFSFHSQSRQNLL